MWSCVIAIALLQGAYGITRDQFYPYGHGVDQKLPRGSQVSSPELTSDVPIVFYGETYETLFVNNYGVVSFRADIPSFLNSEFPLPYPSIAAFYSNIDTTNSGAVYYRETNESYVLLKAEETVQNNFHDYYDFKPRSVFIATWLDVTYSSEHEQDRKNTFQVAIISNGTESFVELLYPEREIQWIQKEIVPSSLPDAKAQAGFIAEDGRVFTLRGSGSHQIRNIVTWSNTHEPGKYIFRVGQIPQDGNVEVPDQYNQNEVEYEEESKTCAQTGASVCDVNARCVDYQPGICCRCIEDFYGNGKSCIKNDVPLRVHGKVNGVINTISLNDVDIQAYVVVADGRSYTALSQVPPNLGSSLQLLNVLGGVIGWLFAKPSGTASNGYQLTGAQFNHTANIYFPLTKDRVTINQEFLGHDVFDQITIESDIRGTVPFLVAGTKLEISEFEEHLTIVELGVIRSESTRTFVDKITGEKYDQVVSQTFTYNPACRYEPPSEDTTGPLTLKIAKNYLGYEARDNIVRYGSSNKITPLGQEDPCIIGRSSCGPHSNCIPNGSSFSCACQTGFSPIYDEDALLCVDIDECLGGTHNCDSNADCYNHEGEFECRCRSGFRGNGVSCQRISRCSSETCGPNSQCIDNGDSEPTCICEQGYNLEGQTCVKAYEYACGYCDPNASCVASEIMNNYYCKCNPGYTGTGYQCSEETENSNPTENSENVSYPTTTPSIDVGPTEPEYNETIVLPACNDYECVCPQRYVPYRDERNNDLCRLETYTYQPQPETNDSSIPCQSDSDCPPNAECIFQTGINGPVNGNCVCPDGYVGDGFECIERTGSVCNCGMHAHCRDTASGEVMCLCDSGYFGDGYLCSPSFSCTKDSDCEYNAECKPHPASYEYVCQCIKGYKKDQNDACIPDGQLCNGAMCAEHASCLFDEAVKVSYCQCDAEYVGDGISSCTLQGPSCYIINDCSPDAACTPYENTYHCVCREGFVGDGYTCAPELNCKNDPYMCDSHASCLKRHDAYECECNTGYNGNGSYCELNPRKAGNFLAVSDGSSVYRVPFRSSPRDFATPFSSAIYQIAVGVDVDCLAGRIYWGDIVGNAIKRAAYDGSDYEQFLTVDIKSPEGLAIDWSGRNVFWTDSKKYSIEVANIDTKVRKVLFSGTGITNPRGIAVHPGRGKVFWSDWNRSGPKIEWANMDGSERGVFLDASDVQLPNSLAIDWIRDRLCYADAGLHSIKCVNIDTLERETIAVNCSYPFGLAINGDKLYWSDWRTLKIEYIDSQTKQMGQVQISTASKRLYGVAVAPESCPAAGNVCQYRNGNCEPTQLCLPNGRGSRTCVDGDSGY